MLSITCAGDGHSVCGLILARAAGDVVWQREAYQVPPQIGQHSNGGTQRIRHTKQELLHVSLNASAVAVTNVAR